MESIRKEYSMNKRVPIIISPPSLLKVSNKKGFRLLENSRKTSVLIIVLKGRIRFTSCGQALIATPDAPIYIPSGAEYLNECLEDAESLLFNFSEQELDRKITSLSRIETPTATRIFERIRALKAQKEPCAEAEIFSLLYDMVRIGYTEATPARDSRIKPALEYAELHFCDPELTVAHLAALCGISTVYLNKQFKKELMETPFSYVTRRRMETARDMLREHCPVGNVADAVGYSDVYQFSRAFKRHYGASPKNSRD